MDIKVSFIIPVYKVEKYLEDCVSSVLNQTLPEIEIILVDDGSPDNCPAICDRLSDSHDNISVIHKENAGLAAARNTGIKAAKGKYIFFVDSDDLVFKTAAEKAYNAAELSGADVMQFGYTSCTENLRVICRTEPALPKGRPISHNEISRFIDKMSVNRCMQFSWRNFYKRDFLDKNVISFDEEVLFGEDSPFDMEVYLRAETIYAVPDQLYVYRHRQDSIMRVPYRKDLDILIETQWKKKIEKYEKFCREPSNVFYESLAEYTLNVIISQQLLKNAFNSTDERPTVILKRIYDSEMLRRSLNDYDIEKKSFALTRLSASSSRKKTSAVCFFGYSKIS
ncbi:MAG: glycosyltransferase [Clostridiales bacterium]|nr:glycosyltransferase [Clostridiales bacterium]